MNDLKTKKNIFSLRLKFDDDLERQFKEDFNVRSLPIIRLTLLMAIAMYSVFGFLDIWIVPDSREYVWMIRFAIVVPYLALVIGLSFVKFLHKYMQFLVFSVGIVLGYGIIAMIAISQEGERGFLYYYAGLMLVIMGIFALFRMRFLYAVTSALLVIAGYEVVAYYKQNLVQGGFSNPNFPVFINNNFFFIGSFFIGMFALYVIEYYMRRDFLQNTELSARNEIMEKDLSLARKIQDQLIPEPDPTGYIYSLYKPMDLVGGDFFDFLKFRDSEKIGIFISDVSGHGVPAAFITSMIKTTILQSGSRREKPAELLSYMNEVLQNQTAGNFITAFYGIYDPDGRIMTYSIAGHPMPFIITAQNVSQLHKGNNTALAIYPNSLLSDMDKTYRQFEERLPSNSKLLLVTDGLLDATPLGSHSGNFESSDMYGIFREFHGERSESFIRKLYDRLVAFRGSDSFEDDVCIICIDID